MELGPERRLLNGEQGRCWESSFACPEEGGEIRYKYGAGGVFTARKNGPIRWSREPMRKRVIPPAAEIPGREVVLFDANFVETMEISRLPGYRLWLGPYPREKKDVQFLKDKGITAVLNLQTDADNERLALDWGELRMLYSAPEAAMTCCRLPIIDFSHAEIVRFALDGARLVKELHDQGHTVYVHCTAGMGRSAAVCAAYLCLYGKMSPDEALKFMQKHRPIVCPNMEAVREALEKSTLPQLGGCP